MGHATMLICGVVLLLLCGIGVAAATGTDRKRDRSGVTPDTGYRIRPVPVRPRRPATPARQDLDSLEDVPPPVPISRTETTRLYGVPYIPPVPSKASKVHDRNHCPGCQCR